MKELKITTQYSGRNFYLYSAMSFVNECIVIGSVETIASDDPVSWDYAGLHFPVYGNLEKFLKYQLGNFYKDEYLEFTKPIVEEMLQRDYAKYYLSFYEKNPERKDKAFI